MHETRIRNYLSVYIPYALLLICTIFSISILVIFKYDDGHLSTLIQCAYSQHFNHLSTCPPDICLDPSIDAATHTEDGSTYMFKGDYYWKVLSYGIADGYPRKIKDDWVGLEGNLDAAYTWSNKKTYILKGGRYWRFMNKEMDGDYPKPLSFGFEGGIPDNVDAAFVWSGNGKSYFFKGDQYWRYDSQDDPPEHEKFPRPISNWIGIPNNIDATVEGENNVTYFFKGDKYYRYNDITEKVDSGDPPYPRPTAVWWFGCKVP